MLQRLCTADVAVPVGRAVYTGMLNARGGYEADVTVTRLAHDRYLLVTGSASVVRDLAWIERHIGPDEHVAVVDVSSAYAVFGVMGPSARELLQRLTRADLSDERVPVRHQPGDRPGLLDGAGHPDHLRGGAGLGALRARASSPSASTRPCSTPVPTSRSPTPATTPSTPCGWTRGTGPSAPTSRPTTTRWRPASGSPASWPPTSTSSDGPAVERVIAEGPRRRLVSFRLEDPGPDAVGRRAGPPGRRAAGQVTSVAWSATLGACVGLAYVWRRDREPVTADHLADGALRGQRGRSAACRPPSGSGRPSTRPTSGSDPDGPGRPFAPPTRASRLAR